MESTLLETAIKLGNVSQSLYKNSPEKAIITELQKILFELGFKSELNFDNYEASGVYDSSVVNAVHSFATKNKFNSDGSIVSTQLAQLMLQRHDFLPSMYILWTIYNSDLRTKKYISRGTRMSVTAIQTLLNEKGYGAQLDFPKYGADGLYGKSTREAVVAYAKDHNIDSDGDLLTRPLIDLMIADINPYYGKSWSELAAKNLPSEDSPLVLFEGSRFLGKPCRADTGFIPALQKINGYAEAADVYVYVTSSFRTSSNVGGAIVKPATMSNHMAGHAIDMNVVYDNRRKSANSKELAKYPAVAPPVRQFIKSIIDDKALRWGGTFRVRDTVHIDDNLNGNMTAWNNRYFAMQKAVQLGA